ncbi:hypothetical protein HA052_10995 [Chromobacterium haemolyticum]|uniref:Uncharacterized protein n=1 Tax=Chromobacterium fluminis TaxID=3044269 RepID=A0ABX0L8N1_9NEIS|nr:hypothetical protein [Chromobacterium haemolyticum]NHR05726.1 hypothetical protein [Chromobacterium haemolyticum]
MIAIRNSMEEYPFFDISASTFNDKRILLLHASLWKLGKQGGQIGLVIGLASCRALWLRLDAKICGDHQVQGRVIAPVGVHGFKPGKVHVFGDIFPAPASAGDDVGVNLAPAL